MVGGTIRWSLGRPGLAASSPSILRVASFQKVAFRCRRASSAHHYEGSYMIRKYLAGAVVVAVVLLSNSLIAAAQPSPRSGSARGAIPVETNTGVVGSAPRAEFGHAASASEVNQSGVTDSQTSGTVWIPGTFPGTHNFVNQVSCWAPGDCLAIGSSGASDNGTPLATLFTNGVSKPAPAPSIAAETFGFSEGSLSCTGPSFCMVANGASNPTPPTLFYEFNGASWEPKSSPALTSGQDMAEVSCSSSTMCVSAGYAPSSGPLVDEFNGATWSSETLPALPPSTVSAVPTVVSCVSSFCMLGPVAESSTGALWMATLSAGEWTDTEITSVTPEGSTNYQVGSLSCPSAGSCLLATQPPGAS
jgi:hypothetical protein